MKYLQWDDRTALPSFPVSASGAGVLCVVASSEHTFNRSSQPGLDTLLSIMLLAPGNVIISHYLDVAW